MPSFCTKQPKQTLARRTKTQAQHKQPRSNTNTTNFVRHSKLWLQHTIAYKPTVPNWYIPCPILWTIITFYSTFLLKGPKSKPTLSPNSLIKHQKYYIYNWKNNTLLSSQYITPKFCHHMQYSLMTHHNLLIESPQSNAIFVHTYIAFVTLLLQ
jgi:hypothetical protein